MIRRLRFIQKPLLWLMLVGCLSVLHAPHSHLSAEVLIEPQMAANGMTEPVVEQNQAAAAGSMTRATTVAMTRATTVAVRELLSDTFTIPVVVSLPEGEAPPEDDASAASLVALDIDINYNVVHVQAIECVSTDEMDMMACSIRTDGLVQIAAIDAEGLLLSAATDDGATIAQVTFSVVDPAIESTEFTTELDELYSASGVPMDVKIGPASSQLPGHTDGTGTDESGQLYLPIVR